MTISTTNLYSIAQSDLFAEKKPARLIEAEKEDFFAKLAGVDDDAVIEHFMNTAAEFYSISLLLASRKLDGYSYINQVIDESN